MNLKCCLKILAIFAIVINNEISEGARILGLFPLTGKSHTILGEQIMKSLAKKGHQVDFVSHYPLKEPFPNYNDLSLRGSLKDETNNMNFSMVQSLKTTSIKRLMDVTADPICELLKHPVLRNLINNPPNDPPYDLVIVEIFTAHCYFAFSRHLKVPMIGVIPSVMLEWENEPLGNPSCLSFISGGFTGLPSKLNFWDRLQNVFIYNVIRHKFNYYAAQQKKYVNEYFGPGYPSIYELSTEFSLVLVNSHFSLNGIRPFTPGVVEIGGIHIQDNGDKLSPELQKWLDESKNGCIYVSFGSMVIIESFPKETMEVFYTTFKNISPIRVLLKIANEEKLPPGLPDNVKTHHWLPQMQVLKHTNVKAFVTHGGLMGTLESIHFGVPMVGFPLFGDQLFNLKTYEDKKIAVKLDYLTLTVEEFTKALNTVLKDPEYRNNIKKISKLFYDRPMSPQDTAVFWVEYVLKHGNVLKSPAVNLSWYQVELLDIFGFLLVILLISSYIIYLFIKTVIRFISNLESGKKNSSENAKNQM